MAAKPKAWERAYWATWGSFKKAHPQAATEELRKELALEVTQGRSASHKDFSPREFSLFKTLIMAQLSETVVPRIPDTKEDLIAGILRRVPAHIAAPDSWVFATARRVLRGADFADWRQLPNYQLLDVLRALDRAARSRPPDCPK